MPDRRSIFRLLALAGFLLTVALALWLAEVRPLVVILVMAFALVVAWAVEWLSWRQELPHPAPAGPVPAHQAPAAADAVPHPPAPAVHDLPPPALEAPVEQPAAVGPPALFAPAPPADPEPVVPGPPPAPPAPPERPPLRPVPPPEPEPAPQPPPEPALPAARAGVVDLRMRATMAPRRWNLWDLERRARDEQQRDPARYEEWSYLFVHLRQFATPDGFLPTEFDGLVRESFGALLEHAG